MSQLIRIILIVLVLVAAVLVWMEFKQGAQDPMPPEIVEETQTTYTSQKGVELIVTSPMKDSVSTSLKAENITTLLHVAQGG